MKKGHNFIYNYALSDRGISANQQLNALKLALTSQGTPPQLYSLNGYAEDRVCLDQQDHKWIVYIGTRGQKADSSVFDTEDDACLNLIERISDSLLMERKLKKKYNQLKDSAHSNLGSFIPPTVSCKLYCATSTKMFNKPRRHRMARRKINIFVKARNQKRGKQ